VLLEQEGDLRGAEAAYRRADAAGIADGTFNLGALLETQGRLREAEAAYEHLQKTGDGELQEHARGALARLAARGAAAGNRTGASKLSQVGGVGLMRGAGVAVAVIGVTLAIIGGSRHHVTVSAEPARTILKSPPGKVTAATPPPVLQRAPAAIKPKPSRIEHRRATRPAPKPAPVVAVATSPAPVVAATPAPVVAAPTPAPSTESSGSASTVPESSTGGNVRHSGAGTSGYPGSGSGSSGNSSTPSSHSGGATSSGGGGVGSSTTGTASPPKSGGSASSGTGTESGGG
jgi:uncharacterized membrane protein YgcG